MRIYGKKNNLLRSWSLEGLALVLFYAKKSRCSIKISFKKHNISINAIEKCEKITYNYRYEEFGGIFIMLISFRVSNFLSFDEMQELSMIAGKTRKKMNHINSTDGGLKLLKFSALYGANASGKSNLLKAISYAKNTILNKLHYNANSYCRIYSKNKEEISTFDFEIKIGNKCYAYGFDILIYQNSIKKEWLSELANDKENNIYYREVGVGVELNDKCFKENVANRLKIYAEDIKDQDDILFLTVMNTNKDSLYNEIHDDNLIVLKEVFDWFKDTLTIIGPTTKMAADWCYGTEEGLEKITDMVSQFDTGISKCKTQRIDRLDIKEIPKELLDKVIKFTESNYNDFLKKGVSKANVNSFLRVNNDFYIIQKNCPEKVEIKTVKFEHRNNNGEYLFSEESEGTIRILDIVEILLAQNSNRVYLVDELDRCLHPKLTCKFIQMFLNKKEDSNVQLFVTTHESRLLDLELLRRDEVWFADREENGPTKIYSLEEYSERFDKKIDKAYLEGRYGGVPVFKNTYEEIFG